MKKVIIFFVLVSMYLFFTSCDTVNGVSQTTEQTDKNISIEILDDIANEIETVVNSFTSNYCTAILYEEENGVYIHVNIDPIVLDYQFGRALYESTNIIKKSIAIYDFQISKFFLSGFYYVHGDRKVLTWDTVDLKTGSFVDTKGNYAKSNIAYEDVLNYCEYEIEEESTDEEYVSKIDISNFSDEQIALVTAPTEDYIVECLRKVSNITDIDVATEDNDPNNHLNEDGWYTS